MELTNTPRGFSPWVVDKKLEKIITRSWWDKGVFDRVAFVAYGEAVKLEVKLFDQEFLKSQEYKSLLDMDEVRLKDYVQGLAGLLGG